MQYAPNSILTNLYVFYMQADVVISLLPPSCHAAVATECIKVLNSILFF